ncbi:PQ-loop domain-containing transporter [Mycoplasmopsis gallinarum]|uniref:PQ-loop domain-containing transporter n=1 Tax=Mycoplasmopsis gallinarum TaxID=29557 RepID=UPI00048618EF|nr:PQ-loop domain-containing transporter [Mycoplasmopsis gallinarum]
MYKFFGITDNNMALSVILIILSLITFGITLSLSIPQLIHSIKVRKTHPDTKYYSFWLFYVGLLGWIIFGGFGQQKLASALYANSICVFIYSFVLFFLYKDSIKKWRQKNALWVLVGTLIFNSLIVILSFLAFYGVIHDFSNPKYTSLDLLFAQITPMLTTFAFLPQILKGFETKNFGTMSKGMVLIFTANNIFWILYFIFTGINDKAFESLISPLIFQTLSLVIYGSQYGLMTRISLKEKQNVQK